MSIGQSATGSSAGILVFGTLRTVWPFFCLLLLLLFTLAVPVLGLVNPALNWDVLPYVGIVKSWTLHQPAAVHDAAYADVHAFAAAHGLTNTFQQLVTAADQYRRAVAADPNAFWAQLPLYRVRPLYEAFIFLASQVTGTAAAATLLVTFIATLGTNLMVAWLAVRRFGIAASVLPVALFACSPFLAAVDALSTPDALLTLFVSAGVVLLIHRRDRLGAAVLFLAMLVRSDAVLLNLLLAGALCLGLLVRIERRSWRVAACILILLLSVVAERIVEHVAGNYGYGVLYKVTFFGPAPDPAAIPAGPVPLWVAAQVYLAGLQNVLWDSGSLWFLLGLSLIAGVCLRGGARSRSALLLGAIVLWIVARFVLFPSADTRFATPQFAALSVLLVEMWPAAVRVPDRRVSVASEAAV